jgi:hypothetical protein
VTTTSQPSLEAPGKGLPPFELAIGRYVLFPLFCAMNSNQQAADLLVQVGAQILKSIEGLAPEQKRTPILIDRIPGLEDSSRYWSPLMVLEHLLITGTAIAGFAQGLSEQKTDLPTVRIEEVKPNVEVNEALLIKDYQEFLESYPSAIQALPKNSFAKHAHPWFGPINLHQWLCLNAYHHQTHQKQLDLIIKRLV